MIKSIGYAYQSSPMAKRLGASLTGCYYLATYSSEIDPSEKSLSGPFLSIAEAEAAAQDIVCPWSRYSKRAPAVPAAIGAPC